MPRQDTDVTIAFASCCMGRAWQAKQTMRSNLDTLKGTNHYMALCNYNSGDDLDVFVREHFEEEIHTGALVYFHTREPEVFHVNMAKNTAHRLALRRDPSVLFNLDIDNWISSETLELVEDAFRSRRRLCLHNWSGVFRDGSFGRIALNAYDWRALGGYNENQFDMVGGDTDLLQRTAIAKIPYQQSGLGVGTAVQNTAADKLMFLGSRERFCGQTDDEALQALHARHQELLDTTQHLQLELRHQRRFGGLRNHDEEVVI